MTSNDLRLAIDDVFNETGEITTSVHISSEDFTELFGPSMRRWVMMNIQGSPDVFIYSVENLDRGIALLFGSKDPLKPIMRRFGGGEFDFMKALRDL